MQSFLKYFFYQRLAPKTAPEGVTLQQFTNDARKVQISWIAVPSSDIQGIFDKYVVYYQQAEGVKGKMNSSKIFYYHV